jgi:starch phosphorylase
MLITRRVVVSTESIGLQVTAVAYDNPIPGYGTNNTINLRLWAAKPDREFDLEAFNTGDYIQVWLMSFPLQEPNLSVAPPDTGSNMCNA